MLSRGGNWFAGMPARSRRGGRRSADGGRTIVYLTSHRIMPGHAMVLREFLNRPRADPLRIIYLDSRGGKTIVALRMAKMIHEHSLTRSSSGWPPFDGWKPSPKKVRFGAVKPPLSLRFLGGTQRSAQKCLD
jgi:hypothetical protein